MNLTQLILHRFDPEWIHDRVIDLGSLISRSPGLIKLISRWGAFQDARMAVQLGNLHFPNPIGLAAGFDKNGEIVPVLEALGFGFVEVGTVTPRPQPGNPKPRLFRLKHEKGLINRMGFNNKGLDAMRASLQNQEHTIPVGVNIGKNKDTPIEDALEDYKSGIELTWDVADYFCINISSPNTEQLRELQKGAYLKPLVAGILAKRDHMAHLSGRHKQVWLKIAPDLTDEELEEICMIALDAGIDALVVSNTTVQRSLLEVKWHQEAGGLSGNPLLELSNRMLAKSSRLLQGKLPLVGVGGIDCFEDIQEKISLGASLVQLYTSLIYNGPGFIRRLKRDLSASGGKN